MKNLACVEIVVNVHGRPCGAKFDVIVDGALSTL